MSTGPGGKRPAADTPQRIVVRGHDSDGTGAGVSDTAVAGSDTQAGNRTSPETPVAKAAEDLINTTLAGRYLITRQVGQGGMGAVYEATHTLINKRVAVKVLLEKYAKREALVQRLEQEAKLASSVGNEHIIDITDFGETEDGRTFVVMEYLEGESLAECLAREQKLPEQRILRLAAQTAAALAAAHDKGVVHRDIKPENLFLLRRKDTDFVKVLDFGISKSLRATGEDEEQPRLTQTGMVLGTPLYMSPEQARGDDDLDHRVDVYALGVIMYEASTGRVPFAGTNYLSVISQVLNEDPAPPRELRPELSEEFEAIVQRAMAKDREERYATARDLAQDLNALVDDPTRSTERAKITGPRRRAASGPRRGGLRILTWVAGVAVLVAAIVVTVTFAMGGPVVPERKKPIALPLPPPPADAAVVAPLDAPALLDYTIHTDPPGGKIYRGSELLGSDGVHTKILDEDKNVTFHGELDDAQGDITINPREDSRLDRTITLRKAAGTQQQQQPHPPGGGAKRPGAGVGSAGKPGAGSGNGSGAAGSAQSVHGDGTMGSNPFKQTP